MGHSREFADCLASLEEVFCVDVILIRLTTNSIKKDGVFLEVLRGSSNEMLEIEAPGFWGTGTLLDDTQKSTKVGCISQETTLPPGKSATDDFSPSRPSPSFQPGADSQHKEDKRHGIRLLQSRIYRQ